MPVIFLAMTQKAALEEKNKTRQSSRSLPSRLCQIPERSNELLDWIETKHANKELAKQNFTNTDHTFKFYNQMHQDEPLTVLSEPTFSDFYQPSSLQKQGELIFVGSNGDSVSEYFLRHFRSTKQIFWISSILDNSSLNLFFTLETSIFRIPAQP